MNDNTIYPVLPLCNPDRVFSLHGDDADFSKSKYLYLMMGVCVVERIPNDPEHFLYKMLIARLRIAGFRHTELRRVFKVSENTIRKWAKTLRGGSGEECARVFGIADRGKLTTEIRLFIKMRYRELRRAGANDYRKVVQAELLSHMNLSVSGESLRVIFREADDADDGGVDDSTVQSAESPVLPPRLRELQSSWPPSAGPQRTCDDSSLTDGVSRNLSTESDCHPALPTLPASGQRIPSTEAPFHHIGLFFFSPR